MRRPFVVTALAVLGIAGAAMVFATVAAQPAAALPSYTSVCSACHAAPPVGTVSAAPSTATPAIGAAYTVDVGVNLGASGTAGYWITSNDAGTPDPNVAGGPGASPFSAAMTAPSAAGAYTYTVHGAKGRPSAGGQAATTTFSITVAGSTPPPDPGTADTVAPTTVAPATARAVRGRMATLRYRVNDATPNLGTATTTIKIKNRKGRVVKIVKPGVRPVNTAQKAKFACRLPKGKYRFFVSAIDASGNLCSNVARNILTVK